MVINNKNEGESNVQVLKEKLKININNSQFKIKEDYYEKGIKNNKCILNCSFAF